MVALGNFDGFHLGHQAVVGRAVQRGAHERRPVIVATFDPHPVRHFRPDAPPFRLTSLDQRQALFAHAGADAMLVFQFDGVLAAHHRRGFRRQDPGRADRRGGGRHRRGLHLRQGPRRQCRGPARAWASRIGIAAETVAPVLVEGTRISSGRIRELLEAADPGAAMRLLTRPFAVEGQVERGDGRGHDLGWPTANLRLGNYLRPAYGIYAVRVRLDDGSEHDGVASLGIRPMFDPPEELLEANLFGFDGDLYGRTIEVMLHHYLRPEAKFADLDALMSQMAKDAEQARELLEPSP